MDFVEKNKILLRCSWISALGNALLSACKLVLGFFSGSLAGIGDGIDSATDVVVSAVMVFTARIISKPPDREHVYGHEKAEGIATKILSLVIFYAGMQMLITSVKQTFGGQEREIPSMLALYVTFFSIAGKLLLAWYQFAQGKRTGSQMLIANAKNMRNDVVISLSVLTGLFFTFILEMPVLDAITGIVVSGFILKTAIGIFMESNVELMDSVEDVSVYDRIFEAVDAVPAAEHPHRVRARMVGGMYIISLDFEVGGEMSITQAHNIANEVEKRIREKIENVYDIRIHVEPKGTVHKDEKFGVER